MDSNSKLCLLGSSSFLFSVLLFLDKLLRLLHPCIVQGSSEDLSKIYSQNLGLSVSDTLLFSIPCSFVCCCGCLKLCSLSKVIFFYQSLAASYGVAWGFPQPRSCENAAQCLELPSRIFLFLVALRYPQEVVFVFYLELMIFNVRNVRTCREVL